MEPAIVAALKLQLPSYLHSRVTWETTGNLFIYVGRRQAYRAPLTTLIPLVTTDAVGATTLQSLRLAEIRTPANATRWWT